MGSRSMSGTGGARGPSITSQAAQGGFGLGDQNDINAIMNGSSKAFEAEFKEFCERPENRPLMERHQAKEMHNAVKQDNRMKAAQFQNAVLSSDLDAQKNIAPFLENAVLRRVIQTFSNDPRNDFGKWAKNPRIIEMLRQAKELMDKGVVSEEECERNIVAFFKDPSNPAHNEFKVKTQRKVRLPTEQLVGALNEHLQERRRGNDFFRADRFAEAVGHYERALSIVEFVVGLSGADQQEIDSNRVATHLNLAAAHMGAKDYGLAAEAASRALDIDPGSVKALLRRAKAYSVRGEHQLARADLRRVKEIEPFNWEAEEEMQRVAKEHKREKEERKKVFGSMFQGGV